MLDFILQNLSLVLFVILLLWFIYYLKRSAQLIRDSRKWKLNDCNQSLMDESVPYFLNGWTVILESSELSCSQIKPVCALGKDLVVYRGSSNKCYVFDAYCPHLGANLGMGGTIVGDSVRCPFHGWTFDQNGQCTHTPGVQIPISAQLRKYQVLEINGFICIWYHSQGNEPDWFPPEQDQIKENKWVFRGKSLNIMSCHAQEIFQHLADNQHNSFVHPDHKLWSFRPKDGIIYKWFHNTVLLEYPDTNWIAGDITAKHTCTYDLPIKVSLLGFITMVFHNYAECFGPTLFNLKTEFNFFGKRKLFTVFGLVQEKQMLCKGILRVYSEPGIMNNLLAKHFLDTSCAMWDRDGVILVNKKNLANPLLAKNENSLKEYRKWIEQFY